ncbi:retrovirus-related pol polyprotein from transposon TNT 1-94 [Tanacetum coccineum]
MSSFSASHLRTDVGMCLAKQGLVRGLPKLKFEKDHLCLACSLGKSKKSSHKTKAKDTNQEKLYLLHMDLCGPMRVESINGKKYILVIVNDYSSKDLGKLKPKADIGIFVGYAPAKKAYQIYNRRTRMIMETIHVTFDELTAMASEHSSPEKQAKTSYWMSMMGKMSFFLGLQISQSPRGIFINQSRYALEIIEICMHVCPYSKDIDISLTAYADAVHARCQDSRRSTSGSAQLLGDKLVSWSSKKQKSTAISSTKAEYIALSGCYVRYHFIKEQVENRVVELYFVRTEYQLADIFTKALPRERFNFLVNKLGMKSMSPETLKSLAKEEDE